MNKNKCFNSFKKLKHLIMKLKQLFSWQKGVKSFYLTKWQFVKIALLVRGRLTRSLIQSIIVLLKRLDIILKSQGLYGVALYLKACHVYTMQFLSKPGISRRKISSIQFGPHVSLTRRGLPRIIPNYLRLSLSQHDVSGCKIVLSIFNLYRVLPYPGKLKLSTISEPGPRNIGQYPIYGYVSRFLLLLGIRKSRFEYSFNPHTIFSSGSNSVKEWLSPFLKKDQFKILSKFKKDKKIINLKRTFRKEKVSVNSMTGVFNSLAVLRRKPDLFRSVRYFLGLDRRKEDLIKAVRLLSHFGESKGELGKLAYKEEPGKVRVFAIVDCWTQWILKPLHSYLFKLLRSISNVDATFDQNQGIKTLQKKLAKVKNSEVYSLDLSAATDRLPIMLQSVILNKIHPELGENWANLLVNRDYAVSPHPTLKEGRSHIRYAVGQPMGAYSSWAMLAITHHYIVQLSAWLTYRSLRKWFTNYMVLGDDVVILDKSVALTYIKIMKSLGVEINLNKSLISRGKICEFAKRLISVDSRLEGLSLKEFSELTDLSSVLSLVRKLETPNSVVLRFLGYGSLSSGNVMTNILKGSSRAAIDHILRSPTKQSRWEDYLAWLIQTSNSMKLDSKLIEGYSNFYIKIERLKNTSWCRSYEDQMDVWEDFKESKTKEIYERQISNIERVFLPLVRNDRKDRYLYGNHIPFFSKFEYSEPFITFKELLYLVFKDSDLLFHLEKGCSHTGWRDFLHYQSTIFRSFTPEVAEMFPTDPLYDRKIYRYCPWEIFTLNPKSLFSFKRFEIESKSYSRVFFTKRVISAFDFRKIEDMKDLSKLVDLKYAVSEAAYLAQQVRRRKGREMGLPK
uniref:RNA-dependent RNA polymerase n=1 Tax=Erysiphales associated mitovirus 1 TaxID=2719863 RepID=A0A6G9ELL7_9VIRU|nr:RNA-dependent RNA polymerase [Erysiphales associated mitovirus 1]